MAAILRKPEVRKRTGLSDTALWRLERAGSFPARRQVTPTCVGWLESEVDLWVEARPVGQPAASTEALKGAEAWRKGEQEKKAEKVARNEAA
jgi:prophage regulatory protein